MSRGRQDFAHRVVAIALVLRLVAIMVALVGMVGETMTGALLVCVLVLSASSLSVLLSPGVAEFVVRHPFSMVLDVLVTLGVVAVLGVDSPLVLATLSTALVLGVLFDRRTGAATAVVLVAGYLLVASRQPAAERDFMVSLGIPAVFVFLVTVGAAVRGAHQQQVLAERDAACAREAAAAADERARLAREMHDSLGKTLHGIALAAEALPVWVQRDPATAVEQARGLALGAHQAADEARRILVRMRADEPDRPLVEVLEDQCALWELDTGTPCTFSCSGAVDLSTGARYEVLAMVGEALENVRRHAHASSVRVRLTGEADGVVRVTVEDDGRGFVPRADGSSPRGHFGLTGMRERAREAGASLDVRSAPGEGTRVVIHHPAKERSDVLG